MKPDDSSLTPEDLRIIEERARRLLNKAEAWDHFPVPLDDLLDAAKVKLAKHSIFSAASIMSYLAGKAKAAADQIKAAVSKVLGLYDASDNLIHVDETVVKSKQNFLALHETGHHDIPTHKKLFRFFQDCEKTLAPEIADQFEREANNFARFVLFKGDTFMRLAADSSFGIKTPIQLASKFGASNYASAREYARTNPRPCVVYVLEPVKFAVGDGFRAVVRRIETSPGWRSQFGTPSDTAITSHHPLGAVLPIGRRMSKPTSLAMHDRNGTAHECLAEALDTTHNIIILLYPVSALTKTTVIMPASRASRT